MTSQRLLGEMLSEIFEGVLMTMSQADIKATSVELSLPINIGFENGSDGLAMIGELPQFLTRTDFDRDVGRMHVVIQEVWL